jgi:fructose-bisphosphate aldolase class 1
LAALNLAANTALKQLSCKTCTLTTLSLTTNVALNTLEVNSNALTTLDISTNVLITYLDGTGNALTQAAVDGILADLDTAGLLNGTVDLSGGTNATPSAAGLISAANLTGNGWTVTTN